GQGYRLTDRADHQDQRPLPRLQARLSRRLALRTSRARRQRHQLARPDPQRTLSAAGGGPALTGATVVIAPGVPLLGPVGAAGRQHLLLAELALMRGAGIHDVEYLVLVGDELVVCDLAIAVGIDLVHHLHGLQATRITTGGEAGQPGVM